jgi:hypothetical protein
MEGYVDEKEAVTSKVTGAREQVADDGSQLAGQARKGAGIAKENPLGLAIGSAWVASWATCLPCPTASLPKWRAWSLTWSAIGPRRSFSTRDSGSSIPARKPAAAAAETAKQSGQDHASDLQEAVRDSTRRAAEQIRS